MTVANKTLLSNVPALALGAAPRVWRLRPGLLLAGVFLMLLVIAALGPGLLAPGDPLEASARLGAETAGVGVR